MYLAGLDEPSLPDDPDAAVAFQAYPAFDMLEAGFTTYNQVLLYVLLLELLSIALVKCLFRGAWVRYTSGSG